MQKEVRIAPLYFNKPSAHEANNPSDLADYNQHVFSREGGFSFVKPAGFVVKIPSPSVNE